MKNIRGMRPPKLLWAGVLVVCLTMLRILIDMPFGSMPPPEIIPFEETFIPVVSDVSGNVIRLHASEGADVSIGDTIIELDVSDVLRHRASIELRIHNAELTHPDARSALSNLYAELRQSNLILGSLSITSPDEGEIISMPSLRPGDQLKAGDAVALVLKSKKRWRP